MTETQAKSGAAEAPANPVEEEAASSGAPATGHTAVGRATVPADASPPKFTRAPGMAPPPDKPADENGAARLSGGDDDPSRTAKPARPSGPASGGVGQASAEDGSSERAFSSDTGSTRTFGPGSGRLSGAGGGARATVMGTAAVGAAKVGQAARAVRSTVSSAASRGPRRARLNVKRIDPWSVMKFSLVVSLVLFIVVIVATSVLYLALDAMGVFESVNGSLTDLVSAGGGQGAGSFKITFKGVFGTAVVLGLVNVVLFTALATLGAFIYNVCADLVGGIELTLAERD